MRPRRYTCHVNGESYAGTAEQLVSRCELRAAEANREGNPVLQHTFLQQAEYFKRIDQ